MPTILQRAQVEELIVLMRTQPDSTSAKEFPEKLRGWLSEPGLQMEARVRALIEHELSQLTPTGRP